MPYDTDLDSLDLKLAQAIVRAQAATKPRKNWGDPAPLYVLPLSTVLSWLTHPQQQGLGGAGDDVDSPLMSAHGLAGSRSERVCQQWRTLVLWRLVAFLGRAFGVLSGEYFRLCCLLRIRYVSPFSDQSVRVVDGVIGGFFLALGATLTPGFNAELPYTTSSHVLNASFYNSFAFFYLFVGVLSFVFFICSLRTNFCLVILFFAYTIAFPLLAAAEWTHAEGKLALSSRLTVGGGAACFVVSMCSWWAMIGGLLQSVNFPFALPMGDLSRVVPAGGMGVDVEKLQGGGADGKLE